MLHQLFVLMALISSRFKIFSTKNDWDDLLCLSLVLPGAAKLVCFVTPFLATQERFSVVKQMKSAVVHPREILPILHHSSLLCKLSDTDCWYVGSISHFLTEHFWHFSFWWVQYLYTLITFLLFCLLAVFFNCFSVRKKCQWGGKRQLVFVKPDVRV